MKNHLAKLILTAFLLSITPTANAGGSYFPIQITDIKTISDKEYQIHFQLLEKVGNDYFSYPLDTCESVTLKIEFQEWELKHKILLFFDSLFNPVINTDYLNQEINKLKTHINKPIIMSDVKAFYYSPHNTCELLSKTIQLQYSTTNLNGNIQTPILQPIRHHSRLENRPQK